MVVVVAAGFLAASTASDIVSLRIPNKLNLAFGLTMLVTTFSATLFFDVTLESFVRAVLAGIVLMAVFLFAHLLHPSGLGMGDVKLAFGLGIFLGWFSIQALLTGLFTAFLMNGFSALVVVCSKEKPAVLPFAPALVVGSLLGLILA